MKTDQAVMNGLPNGPLVLVDPILKRTIASGGRLLKRWQGEAKRAQDARADVPWSESPFLRFRDAFRRPTRNFALPWGIGLAVGPLVD